MNSTVSEITQPSLTAGPAWTRHLAGIARGEQQAMAAFYDESAGFAYSARQSAHIANRAIVVRARS